MSVYQVTREGQNLGSFEASQIQEGLQTGQFLPSDWGWREGMSGWKGLTEIFGDSPAPQTKAIASSLSALVRKSPGSKPAEKAKLNPYAAPASNIVISRTSGEVPHDVIEELSRTRPWLKFISVLMGIISGIILLSGLGNAFSGRLLGGGIDVIYSSLVLLFNGLIAATVIYPSLKLSKSAVDIKRLKQTQSFEDLLVVLTEQRRFWKCQGILALTGLSIMVLCVILYATGIVR